MTNPRLIRPTPIIPAVILLLGGLVGVPETSQSDVKGLPTYSEDEIRRAVIVYANHYRLDPALLQAVIKVESNFRQNAVSRRGAVGLMQLMPGTAANLQVANIHDSLQNIQGGAKQLRYLLDIYHGDLRLALAAYNAGVNRVKRDVPRIRETKIFIHKVLTYYDVYRGHHRITNDQNGIHGVKATQTNRQRSHSWCQAGCQNNLTHHDPS